MTIEITGKYRHRTRVKVLWFWIIEPWKEDPISQKLVVPDTGKTFAAGPIAVSAALSGLGLKVTLQALGATLWTSEVVLPGFDKPFHFEPIKGAILEGTVRVTA